MYEKRGDITFMQSGIAADTMKINGAIRQFKQVSDLFAIKAQDTFVSSDATPQETTIEPMTNDQ